MRGREGEGGGGGGGGGGSEVFLNREAKTEQGEGTSTSSSGSVKTRAEKGGIFAAKLGGACLPAQDGVTKVVSLAGSRAREAGSRVADYASSCAGGSSAISASLSQKAATARAAICSAVGRGRDAVSSAKKCMPDPGAGSKLREAVSSRATAGWDAVSSQFASGWAVSCDYSTHARKRVESGWETAGKAVMSAYTRCAIRLRDAVSPIFGGGGGVSLLRGWIAAYPVILWGGIGALALLGCAYIALARSGLGRGWGDAILKVMSGFGAGGGGPVLRRRGVSGGGSKASSSSKGGKPPSSWDPAGGAARGGGGGGGGGGHGSGSQDIESSRVGGGSVGGKGEGVVVGDGGVSVPGSAPAVASNVALSTVAAPPTPGHAAKPCQPKGEPVVFYQHCDPGKVRRNAFLGMRARSQEAACYAPQALSLRMILCCVSPVEKCPSCDLWGVRCAACVGGGTV
jgi:hypothetical protein